jgi:hypothetical protein
VALEFEYLNHAAIGDAPVRPPTNSN